jgi:hypothetical protein
MQSQSEDVIGRSIATLRQLTAVLAREAEAEKTAKELLLSISILLPKLEAARPRLAPRPPPPRCAACED